MNKPRIGLKRVYEPSDPKDGERFLVERLWPRGVKKQDLLLTAWIKEVAPSRELRIWFSHDPAKWSEFRRRYFMELETKKDSWMPLLDAAARNRNITLIYSSRDEEYNNAVALCEFLEAKLRKKKAV